MFQDYYEDFHDTQIEAVQEFMDDYVEGNFKSKKKDKKYKLDLILKF